MRLIEGTIHAILGQYYYQKPLWGKIGYTSLDISLYLSYYPLFFGMDSKQPILHILGKIISTLLTGDINTSTSNFHSRFINGFENILVNLTIQTVFLIHTIFVSTQYCMVVSKFVLIPTSVINILKLDPVSPLSIQCLVQTTSLYVCLSMVLLSLKYLGTIFECTMT